jgi:glutamyl-tRNA synthetase
MDSGYSIYIGDLRALGYVPEGVLNWIALMGWGVEGDDVMTLEEMVRRFDLKHLNPAPAAINFSKLDHFSGVHIRRLPTAELARRLQPYLPAADLPLLERIVPLIRERLITLDEAPQWVDFLFQDEVHPQPGELVGKNMSVEQTKQVLRRALEILEPFPELEAKAIEAPLRALVEELGLSAGQVFGVLRVAVTGKTVSPPLMESMEVLGRERTLNRLRKALQLLEAQSVTEGA